MLAANYDIALIVTKPDRASGRSRSPQQPAVKRYALEHNIPVIQPANPAELARQLEDYQSLSWGVVSAYGFIIPTTALHHFSGGLVNVHPSLLPRWRGPSPIETALLHGDSKTGNSIMRLTASMDAGPLYAQSDYGINPKDTRLDLYEKLGASGADLLIDTLPSILDGLLNPREQDEDQVTYSPMLTKYDAEIDWSCRVEDIERQVRAYLGWPGSRTQLGNKQIIIEASHVEYIKGTPGDVMKSQDKFGVFATNGCLIIDRLKPAGGRSMAGYEFIRGNLN